jgi:hypothetical protein
MLIPAAASDLDSRFIFLRRKYGKQRAPTEAEDLERLRGAFHTVIKEAEAQQITNHGMVLQLKGLTEGMYLGYYVLKTFKFQSLEDECAPEDHRVSHQRLRLCSTSKIKDTSLLPFGTNSTVMLNSPL